MPNWQVLSGRLTAFLPPDVSLSPNLWTEIVGEEPAESAFHRPIAAHLDGGPFAEGRLTLQRQPMRVDWRYEALPGAAAPQSLGPYPGGLAPLIDLGLRWLTTTEEPKLVRLALGTVLTSDVANVPAGYNELATLIDGAPTRDGTSDFSLQINVPRQSQTINGLLINRLSKWSVGGYISLSLVQQAPSVAALSQVHLRLELDINTSPAFQGVFDRQQALDLLTELQAATSEVAEGGVKGLK